MQSQNPLPDKMYFSIGEVARHFGVSTSLIRYWEDEFPHITPRKNGKGDRRYVKADIEKIEQIYDLIKEKKFTIRGAQAHITEKEERKDEPSVTNRLRALKSSLLEFKAQLQSLQ